MTQIMTNTRLPDMKFLENVDTANGYVKAKLSNKSSNAPKKSIQLDQLSV